MGAYYFKDVILRVSEFILQLKLQICDLPVRNMRDYVYGIFQ